MTGTARGIDVSSWQHPAGKPIDWEEVAEAGITFALVKATQGTSYRNPWVHRDLDDARAAGLLVGAFGYYQSGVDPEAQGRYLVDALAGERLELGAWVDWEPTTMQDWEVPQAWAGVSAPVTEARGECGWYGDGSWLERFQKAGVKLGRTWVATRGVSEAPEGAVLWQSGVGEVRGVPAPVDLDYIVNARSLNIPTTPPPRPTAATTTAIALPPVPDDLPEPVVMAEPGPAN